MKATDTSGYVVFSNGDIGQAHVLAHRHLDDGQIHLGRRQLARWLVGRTGAGSDWAHIQFHMAIFELTDGDTDAAYRRFLTEILPVAATTGDALTDAPALAWRLGLTANRPLPWAALRRTALVHLETEQDAFVELHNLLALAGARDTQRIDRWLRRRGRKASGSAGIVVEIGSALRSYTLQKYRHAADVLRSVVPAIPSIGGSRAQNALFGEMQARFALN